ncbi:unnamed protein product [Kuraishia capsulata CBS 1993]|uniref:Uncharacterized protein n=1 Tax=Kuraishia capsulata CBS 1993 TaxID=1382522 RepID=W6MG92_9ASCO|nr:uncharacterized protein KUCA_T00000752001 [Kuraishia capsulata CBS 1993]CDK24786.1 unnamed protein product [Kuraishia capsulata CBS 1993]
MALSMLPEDELPDMMKSASFDLNFSLGTILAKKYMGVDRFNEFRDEEHGFLQERGRTWKSVFRPAKREIVTMMAGENPTTKHLTLRFTMSKSQLRNAHRRYAKENPWMKYPFMAKYTPDEIEEMLEIDERAKAAFLVRPQTAATLLGVAIPLLMILTLTISLTLCPSLMKKHLDLSLESVCFFDLILAMLAAGIAFSSCRTVTVNRKSKTTPVFVIFWKVMIKKRHEYIFLYDWLGDSIDSYLAEREGRASMDGCLDYIGTL